MGFEFVIFTDESKLCQFNFQVKTFEEHVVESLANREENPQFYEQVAECVREIDSFNHGPVDEDEKIVAEIEEMNSAVKNGDNATIDVIRKIFEQKMND